MSVADAIALDDAVTLQQLQANAGVKFAARVGNLPSPTDPDPTKRPLNGQSYLIKLDLNGQPMDRLAVWDGSASPTGGIASVLAAVDPADAAAIIAAVGTPAATAAKITATLAQTTSDFTVTWAGGATLEFDYVAAWTYQVTGSTAIVGTQTFNAGTTVAAAIGAIANAMMLADPTVLATAQNSGAGGAIDQLELDVARGATLASVTFTWTARAGVIFVAPGASGGVLKLDAQPDGTVSVTVLSPGTNYAVGQTMTLQPAALAWAGLTRPIVLTINTLTGSSPTGGWRFIDPQVWLKGQRSAGDPPPGAMAGDLVTVTEKDHEQLKVWTGSAWLTLFDVDSIKGWISSLNLFQGTVQETGGTAIGTIQMNALPDVTVAATGAQHVSQYWVWTGTAGYVIKATDPKGIGADLATVIMQVGDWLQVSSKTGTNPGDPVTYHWSHIGGDLLARSRADSLFGLNPWTAGNYEKGSLVVYQGAIYRATGAVAPTDTAPGTVASAGPPVVTAAPWALIPLTAGVKNVPADANLPATAPGSDVYLVLNSAKAGGKPALFSYDTAASKWVQLGGSTGTGLDLSGGQMMIGVGCPIGSMMAWLTDTTPVGWLKCDGQVIDRTQYPELFALLGANVPDFRGSFLRGAGLNGNGTWGDATRAVKSWQDYKTASPRTPAKALTGTTSTAGDHMHSLQLRASNNSQNLIHWQRASASSENNGFWQADGGATNNAGDHTHTVTVSGGGDDETVPRNYAVHWIVKASDVGIRYRAVTP